MATIERHSGCEVCGKELLLFKCRYCGKVFCDQHKAPERHNCEGMAEYNKQLAMGTVAKPGVSKVDSPDKVRRPSVFAGMFSKAALAVKVLSVIAVIAASVLAFMLLLGYVESHAPNYSFSIPVSNATGATVVLVDNRSATDPTYASLVAFLNQDKTSNYKYDYPNFTCADFARILHDNAEAAGIRCGFAAIEFDNIPINYSIYDNGAGDFSPPNRSSDTGHGLIAFNTVDRGLVYVDVSSTPDFTNGSSGARIAYVEQGKELNEIDIGWAQSTDYGFYEGYKSTHLDFINDQRAFFSDEAAFNANISAYGGSIPADKQAEIKQEQQDLNSRAADLNTRSFQIGPFYFPQGIVKDVNVYW